jgi:putative transcriptional regulator
MTPQAFDRTMTEQSETLETLFAARRDDPAIRLLAETTAAMRADADYFRREDDVAGGLFLAEEAPTSLSQDAFAKALARIDADAARDRQAHERAQQSRDPRLAELQALPSPLREAALEALEHRSWTFGGFGIRRLALMIGDGTEAELMRVEPGFGAAPHDHRGEELTLIVTGAYDDGHDRYQAGDLSVTGPGFTHAPKAEKEGVCYLLAVTYGPPKFVGAFGLLQTALGFPWAPKALPA